MTYFDDVPDASDDPTPSFEPRSPRAVAPVGRETDPGRMLGAPGFEDAHSRLAGESAVRLANADRMVRFGCGFLDDALVGIFPDDFVILAAKTGAGKTQLALSIALANAQAGKRVAYFALEAAPVELERRAKFSVLASLYFRDARGDVTADVRYPAWKAGRLEREFAPHRAEADAVLKTMLAGLQTFYPRGGFTAEDFARMVNDLKGETDLLVLDHMGFLSLNPGNEFRAQKDMVMSLRETTLDAELPVVAVSHIRKPDARNPTLLPDISDLMGSSDIGKVGTKVVLMAPDYETQSGSPHEWSTFMRAIKNREDSSVHRYAARCTYDARRGSYLPHYELGKLVLGDTGFESLCGDDMPRWATS